MANIQFGNFSCARIAGFKISTALDRQGLGDRFRVYILLCDAISDKFSDLQFPAPVAGNIIFTRDALTLADSKFTYTFTNIDWIAKDVYTTQSQRFWLLTFQYNNRILRPNNPAGAFACPITLENNQTPLLTPTNTRMGYQFQFAGTPKPLLGLQSHQNPTSGTCYRFVMYRDRDNSWLQTLLEQNTTAHTAGIIPGFTVNLNDNVFAINDANAAIVYYEETYGLFNLAGYYPLEKLLSPTANVDFLQSRIDNILTNTPNFFDGHSIQYDTLPAIPQNIIESVVLSFGNATYAANYNIV